MRKQTCSVPQSITPQLDALTRELSEFGVTYVGHGMVSTEGDHTGYFSHPEWKNRYLDSKFFHTEPILDAFLTNPFDVVHWEYVENNQVACMRKSIVGIVSGVTLCRFYPNFFGFLNIGFSDERNTHEFLKDYRPLIMAYHHAYDQIHLRWRTLAFPDTSSEHTRPLF